MGTQSPTHKHEIGCYVSLGAHNTRNMGMLWTQNVCELQPILLKTDW
jgi:hypothetical protein